MAIEPSTFETIVPSRYISLNLPVPSYLIPHLDDYVHTTCLRIAVIDSPRQPYNASLVAAMLVPKCQEDDWIFATEAGHLQLLFSAPGISRLILVGNAPSHDCCLPKKYERWEGNHPDKLQKLEGCLYPLLVGFLLKDAAESGHLYLPFLRYEDNVLSSVIFEKCRGTCVGEILIEDVEIEGQKREFRRRLRFQRVPNFVQSEIRISPSVRYDGSDQCCGEAGFEPDLGVLVHPYLAPMVASLSLISAYLQECLCSGTRPKTLCIGVGGGSLLSFLHIELGLEVIGVEVDEVVLRIARKYFGLLDDKFIQVYVGDGIELLNELADSAEIHNQSSPSATANASQTQCCRADIDVCDETEAQRCRDKTDILVETKTECCKANEIDASYDIGTACCKIPLDFINRNFDIIMVDLDSSDCSMGITAPPLKFVQKSVLLATRSCLSDSGILVLNTIPPDKMFYKTLVTMVQEVFMELHEMDTGNGENYVLIASMLSVDLTLEARENAFFRKLKSVIPGEFVDSIRKVSSF